GYTGHLEDTRTGLSYMQQRYYDPALGRFLSVDPVTVDANTGANYNRYWYANNNPYTFMDPDGQLACHGRDFDCHRKVREMDRSGRYAFAEGDGEHNGVRTFDDLPDLPDGVYNPLSGSYTGEGWEPVYKPTGEFQVR